MNADDTFGLLKRLEREAIRQGADAETAKEIVRKSGEYRVLPPLRCSECGVALEGKRCHTVRGFPVCDGCLGSAKDRDRKASHK